MYLTPDRLKTMKLGVSLSGIPDIELASILDDAQAVTDSYCNMPLTPVPGNFLGQVIVGEEHRFRYPDSNWDRGSRRVYTRRFPVISVERMQLKVGEHAIADIPVSSIVVSHTERWLEPTTTVLSNSSGLFGIAGWIVPLGGLIVPMAIVDYTVGWSLPVSGERLWQTADDPKAYQGSFGWWITGSPATVAVTDNGTAVDSGKYDLDEESGRVTFHGDYTVAGVVRASYSHRLPREIERAQGYIAADLLGDSQLRRKGFLSGVKQLKAAEISVTRVQPPVNPDLEDTVPKAAQMLAGFRHWSMA